MIKLILSCFTFFQVIVSFGQIENTLINSSWKFEKHFHNKVKINDTLIVIKNPVFNDPIIFNIDGKFNRKHGARMCSKESNKIVDKIKGKWLINDEHELIMSFKKKKKLAFIIHKIEENYISIILVRKK